MREKLPEELGPLVVNTTPLQHMFPAAFVSNMQEHRNLRPDPRNLPILVDCAGHFGLLQLNVSSLSKSITLDFLFAGLPVLLRDADVFGLFVVVRCVHSHEDVVRCVHSHRRRVCDQVSSTTFRPPGSAATTPPTK